MKKFLLTLSMFSVASIVTADDSVLAAVVESSVNTQAVTTEVVAPVVEAPVAVAEVSTEAKAVVKPEEKTSSMLAKVKSYVPKTPEFVTKSVKSVESAIIAHPFRAIAIAAIATFAVVRAIDYASASEDEDDNF